MLELSSKRWRQLRHAYGPAGDIPQLLDQLRTAPGQEKDWQAEPWFSLWSALCHQDDVYTASYAAVPHVVAIAETKPPHERAEFIHFVAWIEVCRQGTGAPALPADLKTAYVEAHRQAAALVLECLSLNWAEAEYRMLLGGLAVLQGKPKLGAAIIDPPAEYECPACGTLFPAPDHELFGAGELEA